jgi:DNA-binding NarL/FixJ family response regulator
MSSCPPQVLILDDHQAHAEALAVYLQQQLLVTTVIAATPMAAVEQLHAAAIELVISEVSLAGELVFEWLAPRLAPPAVTRVMLLSGQHCDHLIDMSLRLPVRGYLLKQESLATVTEGVRAAIAGDYVYSPAIAARLMVDQPADRRLTAVARENLLPPVQLKILQLLVEGWTVKEVAKLLQLTVKSVDSHKYRMMRHLDVHNLAQLARYAVSLGLAPAQFTPKKLRVEG